MQVRELLTQFSKDEAGATAIEYALIATIIGLGIISSLQAVPTKFSAMTSGVTAGL